MKEKQAYYLNLIVKYFSSEANDEDIKMLSLWLLEEDENKKIFEDYQRTWMLIEKKTIDKEIDVDKKWSSFKEKIKTNQRNSFLDYSKEKTINRNLFLGFNNFKVAAVFLVIVLSSFFAYHYFSKTSNIVVVADNTTIEKILPDKSVVTLNAGSEIEYSKNFCKENVRDIKLKGEAYFNVRHDDKKPFIINADNVKIEVLGTSFYVNTNNDNVEVILTSGSVSVSYNEQKQLLIPGEKVVFLKENQKILEPVFVDDDNYMAFKTKRMIFRDTELNDVINVLNNVYHSNIQIVDKKIGTTTYTNTFDNQSLESVLRVLEVNFDLKIKKSDSKIEISGK